MRAFRFPISCPDRVLSPRNPSVGPASTWGRRPGTAAVARLILPGLLACLAVCVRAEATEGQGKDEPPRGGTPAASPAREEKPAWTGDGLLEVGSKAPSFTLPDASGKVWKLEDLLDRPLVLYFYPMDGTPGCTTEACSFRDEAAAYDSLGIRVVGVSADDSASHRRFSEAHQLNFPLLSDQGAMVATLYGVAWERRRGHEKSWIARRVTYLIDTDRTIRHVFARVDPRAHATEVLMVASQVLGLPGRPGAPPPASPQAAAPARSPGVTPSPASPPPKAAPPQGTGR